MPLGQLLVFLQGSHIDRAQLRDLGRKMREFTVGLVNPKTTFSQS